MQNEEEMDGGRGVDGLNRALYEFREEYFGELRECAEEVRSDVCERLRAPFFRCYFRFGLKEDGFGECREQGVVDVWWMWGCGGGDEDVVYLL